MEWTDEIIARLRQLWDEGLSTAEIGRRLNISKNSVVGKAHRLDLPARPSPIRRDISGARPSRPAPARVTGPTLPSLAIAAEPVPVMPHVTAAPAGGASTVAAVRTAPPRPTLVASRPAALPRAVARVPACCWPIGEPGTPSFRFCGDPAMNGKPYCQPHAEIAYVRVRDRREDVA
ncbi:GcrA family cell cycle regulator [Acidiphilium sp.]|uniref:GcrA family cell cycle regulator n=1 Tax=Acidiphilium sp. TaxID=527 RepID=UPI002584227B|nr:GcrA family cell cycle regulator [Acidiphilium sp.]